MSDAPSPVRVEYRHARLAEAAAVETRGDGLFVALDAPMPVRTTLRLIDLEGEGRARGAVVERVVESADETGVGRGVIVRFVDDDAVTAAGVVGSEHLPSAAIPEAAESEGTPDVDASDGTNAAMAMPAPVVVDDGDGDGDDDDAGHDDDSAESAEADADTEDSGDDPGDSASGETPSDAEESKPRGRRRRSRKRK